MDYEAKVELIQKKLKVIRSISVILTFILSAVFFYRVVFSQYPVEKMAVILIAMLSLFAISTICEKAIRNNQLDSYRGDYDKIFKRNKFLL